VVGLITLQKMRETLMQYRKKNDETNELVEDFQNVKAALQREQQAKPKLQQALDGAKNEIEQLKIKIGRLEKDLEGRPQQNQSQSQEDLKKLEDEIDDLTAKLLAVEAEKRQFEKAREDEVRALQKKCDQLDNQVFKTEMLLAEKNAFLAEQAAIIDQFNFFN
jgi:chromosome segregation ATPase